MKLGVSMASKPFLDGFANALGFPFRDYWTHDPLLTLEFFFLSLRLQIIDAEVNTLPGLIGVY
jgi:hypothetical protein